MYICRCRYCYTIMEGSVGAADGVGFVLDTRPRRPRRWGGGARYRA